jgi:hypothetical protein
MKNSGAQCESPDNSLSNICPTSFSPDAVIGFRQCSASHRCQIKRTEFFRWRAERRHSYREMKIDRRRQLRFLYTITTAQATSIFGACLGTDGSSHFDQSGCQSLLGKVVTSRVELRLGHVDSFDYTVVDQHGPTFASADNSDTDGTGMGHFHVTSGGESTRWVSQHGNDGSCSSLILFPSGQDCSLLKETNNMGTLDRSV